MERALAAGKPALVQIGINRQAAAYDMPHPHIGTLWHGDKMVCGGGHGAAEMPDERK